MSMNSIQELNKLWHIVGMCMKNEMYSGKYTNILEISILELSILEVIEQYPLCMMKKISDMLHLPKSTLTNAIKRLEEKGYVKKKHNTSDKRAYSLELTEKGFQAQQEHRNIEISIFQEFLQPLNIQEIDIFIKLFSKAVNGLDK